MKKYKLLKDLPSYKAGTIFEVRINTITQVIEIYNIKNNDYEYLKAHIFNTDWFEEIKKVEYPLNWRAEEGGKYYYIDILGEVCFRYDNRVKADNHLWETGNYYYQTEEQAEKALEQRKAYMEYIRLIEKLNEGWESDWSDSSQEKYYIYYDHNMQVLKPSFYSCSQHKPNYEYFKSEEIFDQLVDQLGEEKIKLALGFE